MPQEEQLLCHLESGREFRHRDARLLCALFDSRVLTVTHLARMFFEGTHAAAYKRLAILKKEGLIAERPRIPNQPAALFLAKRGYELLEREGLLQQFPLLPWKHFEKRAQVSPNTLRHELDVGTAKAALVHGIAGVPHLHMQTFTTWPLRCKFATVRREDSGAERPYTLNPDGFLHVHEHVDDGEPYSHYFFLEVDRSSENPSTFADKAYGYQAHYRRGGFAKSLDYPAAEFQDFPFLVLAVLRSTERRNNIAARLVQDPPRTLTQVWCTTLDELDRDPLGAIWIQPRDYLQVTRNTPFDAEKQVFIGYHSDPQREKFVDKNIPKLRLPFAAQLGEKT